VTASNNPPLTVTGGVVVIIFGGGGVVCMLTGGLGKVVVNFGNTLAAVGTVALPLLYCGCTIPANDGGTGAGWITAGTLIAVPTGGGGNGAVMAHHLRAKTGDPQNENGVVSPVPGARVSLSNGHGKRGVGH
jgi:hypothetical protein